MVRLCCAAAIVAAASFLPTTGVAGSAEIRILSGSAIEPVMVELIPKFE